MRRSAAWLTLLLAAQVGCGDSETVEDDGSGAAGGSGGAGGGGGSAPLSLTFIDDHNIPAGMLLSGVQLGGLSGLWIDQQTGDGWAICDDPSQYAAPRFYALDVVLDENSLTVTPGAFTAFDTGATPAIEADAEGIAQTATGELYISLEGDTTPIVPPAIVHVDAAGTLIEEVGVDAKFVPDAASTTGVRRNMGFEALSLSPSGATLFVATERALAQDGPVADFDAGTGSRIVAYDIAGGGPNVEHLYLTEPVPAPAAGMLGEATNAISEILAISDDVLWVMERAAVQVDGSYTNTIRIFEVSLIGATDIAAQNPVSPDTPPLSKRLVIDFDEVLPLLDPTFPTLDNFEAMSFGPLLPDGRQSLVAMSDDNYNVGLQRTAFFGFAVETE